MLEAWPEESSPATFPIAYMPEQLQLQASCTVLSQLSCYRNYGHMSMTVNIVLMLVTGVFVNGPYALITTAVSTDLGTHSSLKGNSRALATVTAIIDGTGSVGAAIGPFLMGYISAKSWNAVFTMLMAAALVAGLCLTKLVLDEVRAKIQESRSHTVAGQFIFSAYTCDTDGMSKLGLARVFLHPFFRLQSTIYTELKTEWDVTMSTTYMFETCAVKPNAGGMQIVKSKIQMEGLSIVYFCQKQLSQDSSHLSEHYRGSAGQLRPDMHKCL
ncbi:hypothetical protein RJ640_022845 [Escallonia rubra]|uniref:Glycerol 3-phosphate permease n=1 Tax=Escallonia rubra TaxID=112253 RepID=A0AA88QT56_9ASTE|nr:hypothetical protein RJ640_022845 [Escallonia rubra]